MPRHVVIAVVLVAACGSKVPSPAGPEGASDPNAVTSAGGGLTPDLVATVADRPLFIEQFASLRLDAKERLRAQQRIADWATANGLTILPPATVETAVSSAAAALDPTTNQTCGPALERTYAVERWVRPMGALGSITARIDCKTECVLQVEIHLFNLGTEFYSAPFDPSQPWEAELARRLSAVSDNGGHERHGHANNPVKTTGVPRKAGANDWYLDDNAVEQGLSQAEAATCGVTDRSVALMLDRAGDGGLHCETAASVRYVTEYDAKVNACMCAAAIKLEQPTAKRTFYTYQPPRRAETHEITSNGKSISAMLIGGNEYRPEGTAAWFLRESDSIGHCFVARTAAVKADEVGATLEFDAQGKVAKATIGDLKGMLLPDERTCVTRTLLKIRTPCPLGTPLPGLVRVTLEIREP